MKAVLKWVALFLFLVYGIVGFIVVPHIIEQEAPKIVHKQTQGHLSLGRVSFNPFSFEFTLNNLYFTPPDSSKFTQFKQLSVNFELYSLLVGKIHFAHIKLIKPDINLVYSKEELFNFDWLRHLESESSTTNSEKTEMPAIKIDLLAIEEGRVSYADHSKEQLFEVAIKPIDFSLKEIDTSKNNNSDDTIRLLAHLEDGGFLDLHSEIVSTEPFALQGTLDFESGKIFTGWSYMQEQLNLEVADGKLKAHAHYNIDTANLDAMRIDDLSFSLDRLRVIPKDAHHDILNIHNIALDDGFAEPMQQKVRLNNLHVNDVNVNVLRDTKGRIDWQRYAAIIEKNNSNNEINTTVAETNGTKPWDVLLKQFALNNLKVTFKDEAVVPVTTTTLTRLDFRADHISSKPQTPLKYAVDMKINESMDCNGSGNLMHSKLHVKGDFGCSGINLSWANPYVDDAVKSSLKKYDLYVASGISDFNVNYIVDENESVNIVLDKSNVNIDAFVLKQKRTNYKIFSIKSFSIGDIAASTLKQEASIKEVAIGSPYVYASLDNNKVLNWNRYIVAKESSEPEAKETTKSSSTWHLLLNTFKLKNGFVHFNDYGFGKKAVPTKLSSIYLSANGVDSKKRSSLNYSASMRLNKKGKIKAQGEVRHTPLQHKGTLSINEIQLQDFSPYVSRDHHVDLKRGALSLKSAIEYGASKKKPDLHVKGTVDIKDFVLENSQDDSVLLAWSHIGATPFIFEQNPNKLFVKEVEVNGLYANAIIDANKTMNFAKLSKHVKPVDENATNAEPKAKTEAFPMQIVKVTLKESSANFIDYSLPLVFDAYIHDFNGHIYGISSDKNETSIIELDGVVNKYGAAKLKGSLNTAAIEKFTDINLAFRNIDLVNMSPYSGKFIGQRISNGKLFLDLNYDIVDSQMLGENSIIVKKLELGEEVESPDAVDLPLGLAIALLEDSEGVIDLELPVSGDMNSPEFSYGHIVFQAFFNLITKAITAPFALLGSMLGVDGDALEYVEFEPGNTLILPPEQEKLDKLSKALLKRPKLKLAIDGSFNEQYDTLALKEAKLLEIAIEKAKKEGELFEGETREEMLEDLYEEIVGVKPLKALKKRLIEQFKERKDAFIKAYDAQMIADLSSAQVVTLEELSALAQERAETVKRYLTKEKNIEESRVKVGEVMAENESKGKWVKTKMELVVE
ncbi:MAG: DUF748 domain-containing protein [Campylobacterota bacterium]|nr:DUF748 domain-containing protein [Campylobacterota bacterium]